MGKLGLSVCVPRGVRRHGGRLVALCLALDERPGWIPRSRSTWKAGSRSADGPLPFGTREHGAGCCPSLHGGERLAACRLNRAGWPGRTSPAACATIRPLRGGPRERSGVGVDGSNSFITTRATASPLLVTVLAITAAADGRRRSRRSSFRTGRRIRPRSEYSKVGWCAPRIPASSPSPAARGPRGELLGERGRCYAQFLRS